MRNLGLVLLLAGVLAFFYCSSRLSDMAPVPDGKSISESLQYPAGRWEVGRYGCAGMAAFGLLLAAFGKR
jgi:hypothetical protein